MEEFLASRCSQFQITMFYFSFQNQPNQQFIHEDRVPRHILDEDDYNHGGEDYPEDIYDILDVGQFNQKNADGKDKSREETHSSWSSSEEALMACEGLVQIEALEPKIACNQNASLLELESVRDSHTLQINRSS